MKKFPIVYDQSGKITGKNNPATADCDNETIIINKKIWDKFSKWEKVFIIEHEKGHLTLQTDCEKLADKYALSKTYTINKNAFTDAINALKKVTGDRDRIENITFLLLNQNNLKNTIMTLKKNNTSNPLMGLEKKVEHKKLDSRKNHKNFNGKKRRNFDGTTTTNYQSHKINGITLGGVYFSMTNILLGLILLVVTVQTMKK